jgi:tRNA(Ile)-lysidine synthase
MPESSPSLELAGRFTEHLATRPWYRPGEPLVVAVSGGMDSVVLVHLLRFAASLRNLVVAHFDHRMRPASDGDLRWVRGLARTWDLDFVSEAAQEPPRSEAIAREARYRFLERIRRDHQARWVLTAHHADDQAETVLHRALRGTGPDGLAGIRETRAPGLARPLLPFHRSEIESYAAAARLAHRPDETNADLRFTRNWLRREILPRLDEGFGEAGRRALARLGRLSAVDAEAWGSVLDMIEAELVLQRDDGQLVVALESFLAHHSGVQTRLVRRFAGQFGVSLDARQTETVTGFVSTARSGASMSPRAGFQVTREFECVVFSAPRGLTEGDPQLQIVGAASGSGRVSVGLRSFAVRWGAGDPEPGGADWVERFSSELQYPVRVRAWRPGDRMHFDFGSKKLKKIFGEARVPVRARGSVPVLLDSANRVLWVPGLARSRWAPPAGGESGITICVKEEEAS